MCCADAQYGTLHLELTVGTVFSIELDPTGIDFENMLPGETKKDVPASGIKVTSKTNTGNSWYLFINADSELRDGDKYIDFNHFKWYGWTTGNGTWFGGGGEDGDALSLTPVLAYASSIPEGVNLPNGTSQYVKFNLSVPEDQAPGNYYTIIRFTLTE